MVGFFFCEKIGGNRLSNLLSTSPKMMPFLIGKIFLIILGKQNKYKLFFISQQSDQPKPK